MPKSIPRAKADRLERAKRLEALIARGPRKPRSPNEFIDDKMRDERRGRARARPRRGK